MAKILISCEESQTICKAFRNLGHEAYSNDIMDCSGGHPEWHLKMDAFEAVNHMEWDCMIGHPPCTYLTITGNKWFKPEFKDRFPDRHQQREDAIKFFIDLYNVNIPYVALENPVGVMSSRWRKPNQYVQPYEYGDPHSKKTGLWLKGLPKLVPTKIVEPQFHIYKDGRRDPIWHVETLKLPADERSKARSKTFQGIADAIAQQWGNFLNQNLR
jgi:hypothetical protein